MAANPEDAPEIPILLLGDRDVGKSTFLARLTRGSRLAAPKPIPTLRDLDQPFPFHVRMYNRYYRFEFYDTASPQNYTLLRPALLVLCYSIANPASLRSLHDHWKFIVEEHFNYDEQLPIVMLGLKRDIRSEEDYGGKVRKFADDDDGDDVVLNGRTFVYPQEALKVAQGMRLDRYCECSALTGDLFDKAFEDIARTAAMTTTSKGGKSDDPSCAMM